MPATFAGVPVTEIGKQVDRYIDDSPTLPTGELSLTQNPYIRSSMLIPEGVTKVNDYAFYYCPNMTGVKFPNSLISIGQYAFRYCSITGTLSIPNNVTNIGH